MDRRVPAGAGGDATVTCAGQPRTWCSASVLAVLLALRAGPRQPQVQRARQNLPCSTVVVLCSPSVRGRAGPSCCVTRTTVPRTGKETRMAVAEPRLGVTGALTRR
ncbi:hypothetical protein GCM10010496_28980 [Streptomyces asoensis]|nr:hypothetical protein GCM10010496_28980 [Streptomyces asoensis]